MELAWIHGLICTHERRDVMSLKRHKLIGVIPGAESSALWVVWMVSDVVVACVQRLQSQMSVTQPKKYKLDEQTNKQVIILRTYLRKETVKESSGTTNG